MLSPSPNQVFLATALCACVTALASPEARAQQPSGPLRVRRTANVPQQLFVPQQTLVPRQQGLGPLDYMQAINIDPTNLYYPELQKPGSFEGVQTKLLLDRQHVELPAQPSTVLPQQPHVGSFVLQTVSPAQASTPALTTVGTAPAGTTSSYSPQMMFWTATGPRCGQGYWTYVSTQTVSTQTVAPQPMPALPYRVASGTAPIAIKYQMDNEDHYIRVFGGALVEPRVVEIELNGQAFGPRRIKVEVFADVPGQTYSQPITTLDFVPGRDGKYKLDERAMTAIAQNFIDLMNRLDRTYSASHMVPSMTATLRISSDDPAVNAATVTLSRALTLSPAFVNVP